MRASRMTRGEEESTAGGRDEGMRQRGARKKERATWKKRACLNGERGGVARSLACSRERLKVSLIFLTITPHPSFSLRRPLFGKLKGPTPSRSRHHPRKAPVPLAKGRAGGRGVTVSHSSGPVSSGKLTEEPRKRNCLLVDGVL